MSEQFKDNPWENKQVKATMEPYTKLVPLDPEQLQELNDWLKGPQVEIYRELDDGTDFIIPCRDSSGNAAITRMSDFVSINGVRWNLVPGYNTVPKPVAEFIRQMKEDKERYMRYAEANTRSQQVSAF